MKSKQNYNVNVIPARRKCIMDIFTKNTGGSITRPLPLMLQECGCTRTAGAAVLSVDGGAVFMSEQMEVSL
ncbi:MAG: hypothetical protein K0A89_00010 [ANME-2 cluster archaeon]|nr:hypothetical protein [ANME-2 cluster archaeon]